MIKIIAYIIELDKRTEISKELIRNGYKLSENNLFIKGNIAFLLFTNISDACGYEFNGVLIDNNIKDKFRANNIIYKIIENQF